MRDNRGQNNYCSFVFVSGSKHGRVICCASELLEISAFPSTCFSSNEKLVTRKAQNRRPKDILYRKNGNLKQ